MLVRDVPLEDSPRARSRRRQRRGDRRARRHPLGGPVGEIDAVTGPRAWSAKRCWPGAPSAARPAATLRVGDGDTDAIALAESLGFRLHHRRALLRARLPRALGYRLAMPDGTVDGGDPLRPASPPLRSPHLRLATWNVNSIRTRLDRVTDWLARADVDVLAMQETKCSDSQFPDPAVLRTRLRGRPCRLQSVERRGDRLPGRPRRCAGRLRRPAHLEQQAGGGRHGGSPRPGRHLRRRAGVESLRAQRPHPGRSALRLQAGLACRTA